jgi:hypothetical protein
MKTILTLSALTLAITVSAQSAKEGDFHLDKEYKLSATGTIKLDVSDAKVFIVGSARSTVHVKIDRSVTTKG